MIMGVSKWGGVVENILQEKEEEEMTGEEEGKKREGKDKEEKLGVLKYLSDIKVCQELGRSTMENDNEPGIKLLRRK